MICIVGYAFVDDTDLIQTSHDGQTFAEVNDKMQKAMNLWEGLIKNTGGALATDKCRWWGIDFLWTDGRWRYQTKEEPNGELTALDTFENQQIIQQLATVKAYETLGVWLAADGNHKEELKF